MAFEAEDAVLFDAAFDGTPAESESTPPAGELAVAAPIDAPIDAPPDVPVDAPSDDDLPAPVPVTEDRVLLQFAATVPPDLAQLQRIAADNQW